MYKVSLLIPCICCSFNAPLQAVHVLTAEELAALPAAVVETPPPASAQGYQLDDSFESGRLSTPQWNVEWLPGDKDNVTVVSGQGRGGVHAVRLVNNYSDAGRSRERTEIHPGTAGDLHWGNEYWIGFSMNLLNWVADEHTSAVVFQLHAVPFNADWAVRSGRNLITLSIKNETLTLEAITEPHKGRSFGGAGGKPVWDTPVRRAVWQDWVMHLRPSGGVDGLIEIWCDGKQVYRQTGPNVDPRDEAGRPSAPRHYIKFGLYTWQWKAAEPVVKQRELLFDEIRIGRVEAGYAGGYEGVAPAGGKSIP